MGRFDHRSNFTSNAGITSVVFGAESPILEVELNEMQEVQRKRLGDFFKNFIGDSISDKKAITYANGKLSIADCWFIVGGELIKCTGLSVALTKGETAYLKVKEMDATYITAFKEEGNQQSGNIVENNIKDSRYDFVTSMRTYITYDLVKTPSNTDGYTYLSVAKINSSGEMEVIMDESSVGSGSVSFDQTTDFGEDEEWEG